MHMFKNILVFTLLLLVAFAYGQESETETEKKEKRKPQDRIMTEVFFAQLIDKPDGLKAKFFSRGFNIYFMYDVPLGKSPISIAPGLGFGKHVYSLNQRLDYRGDSTRFIAWGDSIDPKRNNLGVSYFDIPFELRYRSEPNDNNKSWKIAVGFRFGINLASKWKYKGPEFRDDTYLAQQGDVKFKEYKIPNIERIRYGVSLRGGYGPVNLFIYYSISTLFDENNGPGMHPIHVGLALTGL